MILKPIPPVLRTVRVAAYVGACLVLALLLSLRSARAEVREISLELGRDMMPISDLLSDRVRLNINGERLWASSAMSDSPIADVLDRFEAHCHENGAVGATWGDIQNMNLADREKPNFDFGVLRSEHSGEGAVLCSAFSRTVVTTSPSE